MMAEVTILEALVREKAGRGSARAARRDNRVPAVVYGGDEPPMIISIDGRVLLRELHKGGFTNKLIDLKVDGKSYRVLPRETQLDPVTDVVIHVDFLRLAEDAAVRIMVPVVFTDDEESPGLTRGGVLNVVRHEIELICPADSLPQKIVISLAGLDIGDGVHINDVTLPEGARPTITDRNFTIATIAAPTIHVEEVVEEEEEEEEIGEEGEEIEGEPGEEEAEKTGDEKQAER